MVLLPYYFFFPLKTTNTNPAAQTTMIPNPRMRRFPERNVPSGNNGTLVGVGVTVGWRVAVGGTGVLVGLGVLVGGFGVCVMVGEMVGVKALRTVSFWLA